MSALLDKALAKVAALPPGEQDAIASEIVASLADEEAWKARFAEKREIIRRMAREPSGKTNIATHWHPAISFRCSHGP